MERCIGILLSIIFSVFVVSACGQSTKTSWQEQYDLGVLYLSEGNYEEAIIAFTAAIEIDPKQPDAYLKIADAYVAIGNIDSAIATLEQGYEQTQDNQILECLEQLQNYSIDYSSYFTEDMITQEELTIGGYPFYTLTFEEAQAILPQPNDGYIEEIPDDTGSIAVRCHTVFQENRGTITCEQYADSSTLNTLRYQDYYDQEFIYVDTGIRGISTGDTMQNVLERIGVSSNGAKILSDLGMSILIGADQTIDNGYGWIEVSEESGSLDGIDTVYVNIYLNGVNVQLDFINNRLISLSCYSR